MPSWTGIIQSRIRRSGMVGGLVVGGAMGGGAVLDEAIVGGANGNWLSGF